MIVTALKFQYGLLPATNRFHPLRKLPAIVAAVLLILLMVSPIAMANGEQHIEAPVQSQMGAPGTTLTDILEGTASMSETEIKFTGWHDKYPLDGALWKDLTR